MDHRNQALKTKHLRVLIFITTHLSELHVQFLQVCWPRLLNSSRLLSSADVMVFATGFKETSVQLLRAVFQYQLVSIKQYPNPGYQEGAILAINEAFKYGWFRGYDWVVRLNPDVIILNDTWLLQTMQDVNVDGIFVDCHGALCPAKRMCTSALIHTDFFAIRPCAITAEMTEMPILDVMTKAELKTTFLFRSITMSGRDRWLPGTEHRRISGHPICRVGGNFSPVTHDHNLTACDAVEGDG